jgi:signal transduction histidine kinase
VQTELRRAVVIDALLGLGLAWACWIGGQLDWNRPRMSHRPPWEGGPEQTWAHDLSPGIVPFLALLALGVAVRRLSPRLGFAAVVVGTGGFLATGATFGPVFLGAALSIYAMAAALPPRRWVPLTALLIPMIMAAYWREPYLGLLNPALYAGLVTGIAIAIVPAMIGLLRRSRRETERQERDLDRRRYAYEERLRIAREVHDVVGHSLSVINMQAGVALHVLGRRPDQAVDSLEAIKKTSKEALAELRTTLQVFREPAELAPQPGLARLEDLVGDLRSAGRQVHVEWGLPPTGEPLSAAVDQAAFRIIQEALTNVVRHAGAAPATVRITQDTSTLAIEVANPVSGDQPLAEGNGIRGMRERARGIGGTLNIVRRPGEVLVRAELPVREPPE